MLPGNAHLRIVHCARGVLSACRFVAPFATRPSGGGNRVNNRLPVGPSADLVAREVKIFHAAPRRRSRSRAEHSHTTAACAVKKGRSRSIRSWSIRSMHFGKQPRHAHRLCNRLGADADADQTCPESGFAGLLVRIPGKSSEFFSGHASAVTAKVQAQDALRRGALAGRRRPVGEDPQLAIAWACLDDQSGAAGSKGHCPLDRHVVGKQPGVRRIGRGPDPDLRLRLHLPRAAPREEGRRIGIRCEYAPHRPALVRAPDPRHDGRSSRSLLLDNLPMA